MRITLILLSIVALLFISSISWSLMKTDTPWIQSAQKQTSTPDNNGTDIETLKYQIKTEEKIKDLENKYNELARKNGLLPPNTTETKESSGNTQIEIIPVSGKFLSQVLPSMSLGLIENNGIFGLYTFDTNTLYSTYEDTKMGIKLIASTMNYDTFLKNAKALGKEVYTVNETKTFSNRSFYLNPPKSDTLVRLVLEYEAQTLAIEISKTKFPTLKSLLLKK